MSEVIIFDRMQERRGTAANLATVNEVLREGEWCVELDTGKLKVGDGSTAWNSLNYYCAVPLADPGGDRLLFWDDSAGTWAHLTLGTNLSITGTTINAAGGGSGGWTTVEKAADESRNTTTTLADDNTLLVALSAATLYRIRLRVAYTVANGTMDFKYGHAYSGTVTSVWWDITSQAPGATRGVGTGTALVASSSITGTAAGSGLHNADLIILTNTAGTFSFQWAQNTSDANNATVLGKSFLEWR